MREFRKIAKNVKRLITAIDDLFADFILARFFMCNEYKRNIGTSYKGSMKESNEIFRFKERFKCNDLIANFLVQKKYMEVI